MKNGQDASTTEIWKGDTSAKSGCGHAYGSQPEVASDGGIGEPGVAEVLRVRVSTCRGEKPEQVT